MSEPATALNENRETFGDEWAEAEKLANELEAAQELTLRQAKKGTKKAAPAPVEEPEESAPDAGQSVAEESAGDEVDAAEQSAGRDEREALRSQLRELADKLGLTVDESRVAHSERVNFRAEKRRIKAKLEEQRNGLQQEAQKLSKLVDAQGQLARGDILGGLEALGFDPNELNRALAGRLNPAAREALEAKRKIEALERERDEQRQQTARQQQQARLQQIRQEHHADLSRELARSEDATLARAAKVPEFVEAVRAHIEHVWNTDGEQPTTAEAVATVLPRYREYHERLASIFGARGSEDDTESPDSTQETSTPAARYEGATPRGLVAAKPGTKRPKSVSARKAAEVSSPKGKEMSDAEWLTWATAQLRESEFGHHSD